MCGRYYRKADKQKIAEAFHARLVEDGTPSPPWDYNVAPTTIQPIIRNSRDTNERELVSVRWGLVPFFTRDIKEVKGISTINARVETVATSRTYREPFKKRRCLVPASGFYEWRRIDSKNKQPFAFDLINGKMMAFAGLWDAWKDPASGQWLQSYTIITTGANELIASIHERMPVIRYDRLRDNLSQRMFLRLIVDALPRVALHQHCPYRLEEGNLVTIGRGFIERGEIDDIVNALLS